MSLRAVGAFRGALPANVAVDDDTLRKALLAAFATMYGVRKPVALVRCGENNCLYALCDDGSYWTKKTNSVIDSESEWQQHSSLPGTITAGGRAEDTKLQEIQQLYKQKPDIIGRLGHVPGLNHMLDRIWEIVHS